MVQNIFHLGSNLNYNLLNKLHGSCTNYHFIQKMKFGLIHKISTSAHNHNKKKPIHIALFFATSSKYPRNTLRSMPMKFQNINPRTILSTLTNTFTMIKNFALDLDIVACNECSILPSIGFLIYPILLDPPTLPSCKLHH